MSGSVVKSLGAITLTCLGQLALLIDALTDELWTSHTGGWPAWQHVIHSISTGDLFIPGPPTPAPPGLSKEALDLTAAADRVPTKEEAENYLAAVEAKLDDFIKSLGDGDLLHANERLSEIGLPFNLAMTLSALGGHTSYHVGYGDALLRDRGLPGVY